MLDAIAKVVEKIVLSGVDGRILIIPLLILLYAIIGQAKEAISMANEVFREEE